MIKDMTEEDLQAREKKRKAKALDRLRKSRQRITDHDLISKTIVCHPDYADTLVEDARLDYVERGITYKKLRLNDGD